MMNLPKKKSCACEARFIMHIPPEAVVTLQGPKYGAEAPKSNMQHATPAFWLVARQDSFGVSRIRAFLTLPCHILGVWSLRRSGDIDSGTPINRHSFCMKEDSLVE